MGNDVKTVDQNPVAGSQAQPLTPVGLANKETGPNTAVISELKPAGPEVKHEISQESKELGVAEIQDRPNLTSQHQEIGLEHAGPSVPVLTGPTGLVQIPEKKDIGNSGTWLNALWGKVRKMGELLGA